VLLLLSKKLSLWKDSNAPVLYVYRLEYLEGIDQAIHGLETAKTCDGEGMSPNRGKPEGILSEQSVPI
jgi:hypothetical protein